MPQSPMKYFCRYIFSANFFLRVFSVCKTICIFFLPTECRITDECYADGRFPSVKNLMTKWQSYTDEFGPFVKLLNVVVINEGEIHDD
jgi:hypothetical protein